MDSIANKKAYDMNLKQKENTEYFNHHRKDYLSEKAIQNLLLRLKKCLYCPWETNFYKIMFFDKKIEKDDR
ncbi:hypothetical protein [[Mycoplasma] mobile]|uniref:hypothetical protein n=1 Tax=[Mycoplasma] mobile TaxID=2118 RepID=UPI0002DD1865|nr:hypothetical protein [[Mycoplasma] mobile]